MSFSIDQSYAACELIARREAKNFYYAFRVLPKPKRRAICAVYAFMRHADDLADNETLPKEERIRVTNRWLDEWHQAANGAATDNPVFIALRDTQQRFKISNELLDQLVQGTLMDLTGSDQIMTFSAFDDLYQYCYFVASVVGLVCIRIFGYSNQRAEKLAEETGIAFQLTNILRDVREDAERGRVYLPLEDLKSHTVTIEELASIHGSREMTLDERALMEMEVNRAGKYYTAADALLPLIDADSRAALWVLVKIYRRLLEKIVEANYEVFSERISVSTFEKLWILFRGLWMAFRLRLSS